MARRPKDPVKDRPPINLDWFDDIVEVQWSGHPFLLLQAEAFMGLSKNGVDWEKIVAPAANLWHGAFGKSSFVVSNTGFPSLRVFRSINSTAREWRPVQVPFPSNTFVNGIVAGNDRIAICGGPVEGTAVRVAVSEDDGRTWTMHQLPTGIGGVNTNLYIAANLAFSGGERRKDGKFFCFGTELTSGPPVSYRPTIGFDFVTREPIYGPTETASGNSERGVVYHSDDCVSWVGPFYPYPQTFPAGDGMVTFTSPSDPGDTVTIPGTDPWPIPSLAIPTGVDNMASYGGLDTYFAARATNGVGSSFAFSRDGSTWAVNSSEFRNFRGNIAGNDKGLFIWVGTDNAPANTVFLSSFAGGGFSAKIDELAFELNSVPVWGKDKFVSCGFTDVVTSQDGLTWVKHGNPTGSIFLHRVVY